MIAEHLDAPTEPRQYQGWVDADWVHAFALATNDANPLYSSGAAVPPLFTATMVLPSLWESQQWGRERELITGARGSVHGEHDVRYWGPITPGSRLLWHTEPFGAQQTKGGVVATQRISVTDADGTLLVEHFWSNFHIGGHLDGDLGERLSDHTFPEAARSRPVGSRSIAVSRDQAYRYAGVSGDHAGHAMEDAVARDEGYPSKILQGMCTFGLCSGAMVEIGAGGDVTRLRRLAGRFAAPAFPNEELVVTAYDAGITDEGNRALAFEAIQNGVAVIKHGRAEYVGEPA